MAVVGMLPGVECGDRAEGGRGVGWWLRGYFYARNSLPGEPQNAGVGFDSPGWKSCPLIRFWMGKLLGMALTLLSI